MKKELVRSSPEEEGIDSGLIMDFLNEMEKEDRKKIDVYCQKIIKDTIEKNHTLV